MKKLYIVYGFISILFFSLTGCYDLNQYPSDSTTLKWQDKKDAYSGLMGVYSALKSDGAFHIYYSRDGMSDIGMSWHAWWDLCDWYVEAHGSSNASSDGYKDVWSGLYTGVSRANNFIANVDKCNMSEGEKMQYRAEARFLRAVFYNELLNLYGGVPLYDEKSPTDVNTMKNVRSSANDIRTFILNDLDYACKYLPVKRDSVGLVSAGAAYALKGKVYLYNKDYSNAITAFKQVMTGGYGYALYPDYAALFKPSKVGGGDASSEMIFGAQDLGGTSTPYGMPVHYIGNRSTYGGCIDVLRPTPELLNMYECIDGKAYNRDDFFNNISDVDLLECQFDANSQYVQSDPPQKAKLLDMYTQRDPRMAATIILPYTNYKGWCNGAKKDCEFVIANDGYHSSEVNGYVRNALSQNTYLFRKFTPEYDWNGLITDRMNCPVNFPIIRYADVLLMLAECYNQTEEVQSDAVALINQVRNRVGLPGLNSGPAWLVATTREQVFARIQKERAVEFAAEGLRYYDLKRWGLLVSKTNGQAENDILGVTLDTKVTADKNNLWPIPQAEIDMNANLTQNPNW